MTFPARNCTFHGVPIGLALLGLISPMAVIATETQPLLLAREMPPGTSPAGYLVSEKYDGVRALWDGQALRFRGGGRVAAPAWFTAGLPKGTALDGELWLGRGRFDAVSATVRREQPVDAEWRQVQYMVFELPGAAGTFAERAERLRVVVSEARFPALQAVAHTPVASRDALRQRLAEVVAAGGEGLALHRADAPHLTGRVPEVLLKLKPVQDADAVVIGHEPGQGKYAGMLGALRVRDAEGQVFRIGSGLTDALRTSPPPLGTTVSYRCRGRTATGLPRFATLWRVREAGI